MYGQRQFKFLILQPRDTVRRTKEKSPFQRLQWGYPRHAIPNLAVHARLSGNADRLPRTNRSEPQLALPSGYLSHGTRFARAAFHEPTDATRHHQRPADSKHRHPDGMGELARHHDDSDDVKGADQQGEPNLA